VVSVPTSTSRKVDFVLCCIIPLDVWYIIPIEDLGSKHNVRLFLDMIDSKSKYSKYKENWAVLE